MFIADQLETTMTSTPPDAPPAARVVAPVDRVAGIGRTPRLALSALRIVRRTAPKTLVSAVVLQILAAALIGVQLLVLKGLIAGLVMLARAEDASVRNVLPEIVVLVISGFLANAVQAALLHAQRLLGELVGRATLDEVLDVANQVDLATMEDPAFYDELSRATIASTFRPTDMVNSLMALLLAAATSLGVVIVLASLEPVLLPLVLLAGVPVVLAAVHNARQAYTFEYGMTTHARERQHLFEVMTEAGAAKELRVFSAATWLRERYDRLSDERIEQMRVFLRGRLKVSLIAVAASAAGGAIALGALVWLIVSGRSGIATATPPPPPMQLLASRISTVTNSAGKLIESGLFLDDLRSFLMRLPRPKSSAPMQRAPDSFESLALEHVTFRYPGTTEPVLRDISFEVRRGDVVALVGENGSGKTTLVKLLCRLYDVDDGLMTWNGSPVAETDLEAIHRATTVLFQDFVQYHLTVADNIALGRADLPRTTEAIEEAASRAGAASFISDLRDGYSTRLGRQFYGGLELSGGQWQRLALARAFYRGGELLILDEPTAALDPRAEYELFEQMRQLAAGRTVILISHRFANVRMADRIYVLDRGAIVERGSHQELLARDGLYADLFRLQATAYRDL